MGVENIAPLKVNGKEVFLKRNELNLNAKYSNVPYFNMNCKRLFDNALHPNQNNQNRKGVLILNCSCPRVYAPDNIREQASEIQRLYRDECVHLVSVAFSGSGILVHFPPCETWDQGVDKMKESDALKAMKINAIQYEELSTAVLNEKPTKWPNTQIGTLLEFIDEFCGLKMPVVINGYTKMRRGISFRSDRRVPT